MTQQIEEQSPEQQEQQDQLLDHFRDMSEEGKLKFLRLSKRLANMPDGYPITAEIVQTMVDTDTDIPLN